MTCQVNLLISGRINPSRTYSIQKSQVPINLSAALFEMRVCSISIRAVTPENNIPQIFKISSNLICSMDSEEGTLKQSVQRETLHVINYKPDVQWFSVEPSSSYNTINCPSQCVIIYIEQLLPTPNPNPGPHVDKYHDIVCHVNIRKQKN